MLRIGRSGLQGTKYGKPKPPPSKPSTNATPTMPFLVSTGLSLSLRMQIMEISGGKWRNIKEWWTVLFNVRGRLGESTSWNKRRPPGVTLDKP
jgi:hypothetical protein